MTNQTGVLEAAHGSGYCDGFAGDVGGVFGGEEGYGGCDVFRLSEPPKWDQVHSSVDVVTWLEPQLFLADFEVDWGMKWRVDYSRGDSINPYPILGQTCSSYSSEVDQTGLCRGVGWR